MLLTLARHTWNIAKGIWVVFIIPTVVDLFKSAVTAKKPQDILPHSFLFGPDYRTLTLSVLGVLLAITLSARILIAIEGYHGNGKGLKKYLYDIASKNQNLKPVGFAQQSALISVSIPLDSTYIPLHALSDRPRYDVPAEQSRLLDELRQRSDLSPEQREHQIEALSVIWYSQLRQGLTEQGRQQNVTIEKALQRLTAAQPAMVILGIPGSGKSTTLRWLALQMAQAKLSRRYHLPRDLAPRQIPILLHISDYAKALSKSETEQLSFQQFFLEHFKNTYSDLPSLAGQLLQALRKGHCLLLLDGLDEVANDDLRRRAAEDISAFITDYAPQKPRAKRHNRFVLTSRIVTYEAGSFPNYAHYTLQDLDDEQIKRFLSNWCPAVESYQMKLTQGMKELTAQQIAQANKDGLEQRDRLLEAFQNNASIKQLAINPMMLTILALIQHSGKTLPHRRIDLYQVVTRTLLDSWNQETGRRVFPNDEVPQVEYVLGCLAYQLQTGDLLLTEASVEEVVGRAMKDFSGQPPTNTIINQFIELLRSSSGLFVESGEGLFSFMHRTFQEYFVALHLLRKPSDALQQFVQVHWQDPIWREPVLLLISYKSTRSSSDEQQQASELIRSIVAAGNEYDAVLHRNLLFAAPTRLQFEHVKYSNSWVKIYALYS